MSCHPAAVPVEASTGSASAEDDRARPSRDAGIAGCVLHLARRVDRRPSGYERNAGSGPET